MLSGSHKLCVFVTRITVIASKAKQSSNWIATSALPPRNDHKLYIRVYSRLSELILIDQNFVIFAFYKAMTKANFFKHVFIAKLRVQIFNTL